MTDYKHPDNKIPLFLPHSSASTELNKTGSWRYVHPLYDEKTAPCSAACPLGEDIARIELLVSQNLITEAWQTILIENPFPAICGYVCFHPCENACNRAHLDAPIAIHHLERFVGDTLAGESQPAAVKPLAANGKKVAIAGGGPAGLGAAYFLTLLGYGCDIFEASAAPGGILRWGIPAYRLPQEVLEKEIDRIKKVGVRIHCRTAVSSAMLESFKTRYDALFIACGYGRAIDLKIEGAHRAMDGLQFLNRLRSDENVSLTGTAAVIGGGNTAIDVARSLARLGLEPIIIYRRRRQDMPAFDPEVEMAIEEGVTLKTLLAPVEITETTGTPTNPNSVLSIRLQKMKVSTTDIKGCARVVPDGDTFERLQVDHVFTAIGAEPAETWQQVPRDDRAPIRLSHCELIAADVPMIYGGDLTNRVKSVSDAIASGKQAAIALDSYLKSGGDTVKEAVANCRVGPGPAVSMAIYLGQTRKGRNPHIVSADEINLHYFKTAARLKAPIASVEDRVQSFLPVAATLSQKTVLAEARRCYNCGVCNACDYCRLYCPDMSVIIENEQRTINMDYCKGCGLCVAECPRNAMALKEEGV
ncbi:MAG: FAD-dependent oxidoreductase [Deltaproteobacteria bacterium]|jgi:NADPH-dependent glutamate synthase beta subunit-like oxidoreductase|nr:FAD-dependent oxidoreductase [Deltaproteobacteria bacterium]